MEYYGASLLPDVMWFDSSDCELLAGMWGSLSFRNHPLLNGKILFYTPELYGSMNGLLLVSSSM